MPTMCTDFLPSSNFASGLHTSMPAGSVPSPDASSLQVKPARWRLRNCKLACARSLTLSFGTLNRTRTWDRSPLAGDEWAKVHLDEVKDLKWSVESTNASDSDNDSEGICSECGADSDGGAWDEVIKNASKPAPDFVGEWASASIYGSVLIWNEGEEVAIEVLGSKKFQMHYCDKTYVAELSNTGTLCWSDGDIWARKALCRQPTHPTCKFDGSWDPASIQKGVLTWNEREQVLLEILSGSEFRMVYDGQWLIARVQADGKLHWNDGDVWSRKLPSWMCKRKRPVATLCASDPHAASPSNRRHAMTLATSNIQAPGLPMITTSASASETRKQTDLPQRRVACSEDKQKNQPLVAVKAANSSAANLPTSSERQSRGRTVVQSAAISNATYTGRIAWFRGTFGWVDCAEVQARFAGRQVYLHWNDCKFDCPRQWDEIDFQLALDPKGNPKAINAARHIDRQPAMINAREYLKTRKTK